MVDFILLLAAFICFVVAALGVSVKNINLVAVGLALWVLVALIAAFPK